MDNLSNRSLGELFGDLGHDVARLVRKEIELARVEISGIASIFARRAAFIAIGAVLCLAGGLSLLATATLAGIAMGLSPLEASALVTVVVLAIGGLLVWRGLAALRQDTLVPTETIKTMKDTAEWARLQAS
jgi:hypothetical protein